ncbi:MAG: hydrogenase maturation protease [Deltaproteobacteria bacterium]|nr:hydrogenase maturation protease [Deltaproteobacteria bacterium]MBW1961669.1 hydrogenase maturation protease [Deltaproteobacteria bacterium]MBW1994051.1 hydrogenase maturation protease [Deltaproteobacteria bacterium]MBW2153461.1 hydrogenase maturation protease [Deltaproteobacteria bacterium]
MGNRKDQLNIHLIGVGNEFRQDDGVGIFIVRHPSLKQLEDIQVSETGGEAADLMDIWKGAGNVFLFDAVSSGNTPGTIYRFDIRHQRLSQDLFGVSSHGIGVAEAIELSRALNRLPVELIVFGIEGKNFGTGPGLSLAVEQATFTVIRRVVKEICKLRKGDLRCTKFG